MDTPNQQWQATYKFPRREYEVKHRTLYQYEFQVPLSYHYLHLQPRDWSAIQEVKDFRLSIAPEPRDMVEREDFFGNQVQSFSIQEPHDELEVTASFRASVMSNFPPIEDITVTCSQVQRSLHRDTNFRSLQALQFIYPSSMIPYSSRIGEWASSFFGPKRSFLDGVLELSKTLKNEIEFDGSATEINTSVEEFFEVKKGVCQDFAHLMIAAIRSQDLPARYVSGYILTFPREGEPRLEGADASHAWVSVYIPGYGWIDIDPTNDLIVSDQHIRTAVGRDFNDVSPIKGSITGGGEGALTVEVTVAPLDEEPPIAIQSQSQS
ncbi:MAG: transglutaminase family protein [Opitutales bacterium]|nr:transglutaminase family protein [Opitutales bacterium]